MYDKPFKLSFTLYEYSSANNFSRDSNLRNKKLYVKLRVPTSELLSDKLQTTIINDISYLKLKILMYFISHGCIVECVFDTHA